MSTPLQLLFTAVDKPVMHSYSIQRGILTALALPLVVALLSLWSDVALAHAVADGDKAYIQSISGVHIVPYMYLGAKHMVTGYDHLLFLFAVIFFLYGLKQIAVYVTLFAVGHSITMLAGVYFNFGINSNIIDAIIGFSVVYKALDNLGAYPRWFGFQPDPKISTLLFGLLHGLGLASKILDYNMSADGLVTNLISFNIGVEVGQLLALAAILLLMKFWRSTSTFSRLAYGANVALMVAGFTLMGMHSAAFLAG